MVDLQGRCICFASALLVHPSLRLRYRTSHHSPTKQSTGLFCFTVRALSGFESLLIIIHNDKYHPLGGIVVGKGEQYRCRGILCIFPYSILYLSFLPKKSCFITIYSLNNCMFHQLGLFDYYFSNALFEFGSSLVFNLFIFLFIINTLHRNLQYINLKLSF